MPIYRVEDVKGRGPYHWNMPAEVNSMVLRTWEHHPAPEYDGIPLYSEVEGREKFAFASLHDLRRWFRPAGKRWANAAAAAGLMVSVIDRAPSHVGGRQVTFKPRGARRIARLPIKDVLS